MINNKRVLGMLPSIGALMATPVPERVTSGKRVRRDKTKRARKLAKYHRSLNRHQRKS